MMWISIKDRSPKEGEKVLALLESWDSERFLASAIYKPEFGNDWCVEVEEHVNSHPESCGILGDGFLSPKITHWMPLPELPE